MSQIGDEEIWDEKSRRRMVLIGFLVEGSLIALAWLLAWLLRQSLWEKTTWNLRDAGLGVAATLPMLAGFAACMWLRWKPLADIRNFFEEVLRPLLGPCSIPVLAFLSLLAGLGEELLFRGVLQDGFTDWLGPAAGLLLASALFGLCHLITPFYAIIATLMGLYLGWLWTASGNLLVPIVAHALYDFVALVYLLRCRRKT